MGPDRGEGGAYLGKGGIWHGAQQPACGRLLPATDGATKGKQGNLIVFPCSFR